MATRDTQLTVQDASEALGVTEGYLRRLLGRGEIAGTKFGNQWSLSSIEVDRLRATIGRRSKRGQQAAAPPEKPRKK